MYWLTIAINLTNQYDQKITTQASIFIVITCK